MFTKKALHAVPLPLSVLLVALAAGCSTAGTPAIPGAKPGAVKPDAIPTRTVLLALKAQIGRALLDINKTTAGNKDLALAFNVGTGSGTFTGALQIANEGGASLSAVIPFTGYAESTLQPKIGYSGSATNVQSVSLTFDIDPSVTNGAILSDPDLSNVQVGTFIYDALQASFKDAIYLLARAQEPKIAFTSLDLNVEFTVTRKFEAGLGDTIIMMPAPDLDKLGPTASGSRARTGIYKLALKIPLGIDAPSDTRRIIVHHPLPEGGSVAVEEPYTDKRYEELLRGAGQRRPQSLITPPRDGTVIPTPNSPRIEEARPGAPLGPRLKPFGL